MTISGATHFGRRRQSPTAADARFALVIPCTFFALFAAITGTTNAQKPIVKLPTVTNSAWRDGLGGAKPLSEGFLCDYERVLREEFARKDAPDEVIALATMSATDLVLSPLRVAPDDVIEVCVYGQRGELRRFAEGAKERYFWRQLNEEDLRSIYAFVAANRLNSLKSLDQTRVDNGKTVVCVHGTAHVLLQMNASTGIRTTIFNPPSREDLGRRPPGDPLWQYSKVVDFFRAMADSKDLAIRYNLVQPIAGLHIEYANPKNDIRAVWVRGGQLCVTVGSIGDLRQESRVLSGGKLGEQISEARQAEHRIDEIAKLRACPACASPDGRWVLGVARNDGRLACYDCLRKIPVAVESESRPNYVPLHYLESHKAFLLARFSIRPLDEFEPLRPTAFRLLDPQTNKAADLPPDSIDLSDRRQYEPWFQRLPQRLESVNGTHNAVWLSTRDNDGTLVGRYDVQAFRWLSWQAVPGLRFGTVGLWVDEPRRIVYFIYKGQLLAVPLCQHDPS